MDIRNSSKQYAEAHRKSRILNMVLRALQNLSLIIFQTSLACSLQIPVPIRQPFLKCLVLSSPCLILILLPEKSLPTSLATGCSGDDHTSSMNCTPFPQAVFSPLSPNVPYSQLYLFCSTHQSLALTACSYARVISSFVCPLSPLQKWP